MTDPTQVLVTVVAPGADGQDVPLGALAVRAHLYRAETNGAVVRTIGAHSVALDAAGHAVLHLSPTDLDQAWNLRIDSAGIDRWVRVPASATPVDWDTLADVDPATLEVAAAPATWQALQDRIVTLEGGELSPDAVGTAVAAYLTEHPVTGGSSVTSVQVTALAAGQSPTASLSAGVLSLGIPAGASGSPGSPGAGVTSVQVSGLAAGASPTASLASGVLSLGIPAGAKGDTGSAGPAGVTAAQVNGLAAGASPTIALASGTLTLGIPAGAKGDTGSAGDPTTVADGAIPQAKVANLTTALTTLAAADKAIPATATAATTYTLALTDAGAAVETTASTAITVTIPPRSTVALPVGTVLEVCQAGSGQVTIAAGAGVTLRAPSGAKTRAQWSTVALRMRVADEWVISGDSAT